MRLTLRHILRRVNTAKHTHSLKRGGATEATNIIHHLMGFPVVAQATQAITHKSYSMEVLVLGIVTLLCMVNGMSVYNSHPSYHHLATHPLIIIPDSDL